MFAVLASIILGAAPRVTVADGPMFISVIEDLPLMPGLTEDVGEAMVFETSTGRVAEAQATGVLPIADVKRFYEEALPQLGWVSEGSAGFRRGGEQLRIDVSSNPQVAGQTRLKIALSPSK